jgi:hypothetical protein
VYLALENGLVSNQIKTTPYAGISAKRWLLGLSFSFP